MNDLEVEPSVGVLDRGQDVGTIQGTEAVVGDDVRHRLEARRLVAGNFQKDNGLSAMCLQILVQTFIDALINLSITTSSNLVLPDLT
jgi:hypothetical protein